MTRKYPTLDEMIQSERREASIALRHLAGESIDSEPLYFRATDGRKILTYAGALNLAELFGIERVSETTKQAPRNGMPATFATVTVRRGKSTRMGAAVSRHPQVAVELAFRNSVKAFATTPTAFEKHVAQTWRYIPRDERCCVDEIEDVHAYRAYHEEEGVAFPARRPSEQVEQIARIRRIDRSPRGERRWKEAIQASNLIASLVPDREDVDWNVEQDDMGWAEELAYETLMEGF